MGSCVHGRPCSQGYEAFGGLAMNWQIFTSSGLVERPKSVLPNYWQCAKVGDNAHVKLLVNTEHGDRPWKDPHTFRSVTRRCLSVCLSCAGTFQSAPSCLVGLGQQF
jgi:hypothetical protein